MSTLTRIQGTVVTTRAVFTNPPQQASPGPADPAIVTCTVEKPDGTYTVETYNPGNIVRDGTGLYHLDIETSRTAATDVGSWTVEWYGSGAGPNVAGNGFFVIDQTAID